MSPILTPQGRRALDDLSRRATESNIPGFIYGASTEQGDIYFTSGGHRSIHDPSSGSVNPDTVLWICSMSKLVTHLAALQLIERGLLSVDTPVSNYFPQFKSPIVLHDFSSKTSTFTPAKTIIRIQHLLNHTSGLKYTDKPHTPGVAKLDEAYTHSYHEDEDPAGTFLKLISGSYPALPLKFEPGTDFAYGWSSDVLGFIVEKVSGKTLEQFFQENIFKPLGMKTSFYLTPELQANFMSLTRRTADGQLEPWSAELLQVNERDPEKVTKGHLGGVGLYSSLRDYMSLLRHILQIYNGRAETSPILKLETVQSLFVPTLHQQGVSSLELFTNHPSCQWGNSLAICSADWAEGRKKGSAFWSGWAGTYFHIDPQTSIAAVFGTQIYPSRDAEVLRTFAQFERTLYDSLEQQ